MGDTDTQQNASDITSLFETWIKTTKLFWHDFSAEKTNSEKQTSQTVHPGFHEEKIRDEEHKAYRSWESATNNFLLFLQYMTTPENREVIMKSGATFADALMHAATDSFENLTSFHNQLLQVFAKINKHSTYNFDDLDHGSFESFRELYRTEIQKYLQIPKIGLPREYQERISRFVDRSSLFNSHLAELLYLFAIPLEKANRTMQDKINEMIERGELSEDLQEGYKEWVKILEGYYMELLKSSEYTHALNDTIQSLAMYKEAKDDVAAVMLKELQIPTNKEMDEVYKDLYQMKKTVNALRTEVIELKKMLQEKSPAAPVEENLSETYSKKGEAR
ncbi:poly(R)-hydroxyalkanoic acid synthase subunit PhaE [Desulforhopalus singaporensis]|uniref:Poly(3-hydroxyalkanoate) polymerase subunit PhaE n=1 Tax=Desulforhopalus singaporensis TaxID=91360 RepID=A0A1H0J2R5_9BACT|nr:poly(R)-hydroxyalkanoic acid synthase subunit PhaE [Desulforhopalus singaporensis]SDO37651.1 Poly(R)-hydroxyalkanoic acid synthase subunit (PHA_synth_III_E) [Desulforhopalus singaporensis]